MCDAHCKCAAYGQTELNPHIFGDSGEGRTLTLSVRNRLLYPIKLPNHLVECKGIEPCCSEIVANDLGYACATPHKICTPDRNRTYIFISNYG